VDDDLVEVAEARVAEADDDTTGTNLGLV